MPIMFFIVSFPEQIIRLIFERGAFGPDSTAMTAELLSVYNAGIGSALVVFMLPLWMCSRRWLRRTETGAAFPMYCSKRWPPDCRSSRHPFRVSPRC